MIKICNCKQFGNTEDVDPSVMFKLADGGRIVVFPLDPEELTLLRFFYSGSYASYFVGTRKQVLSTLEEDLHGIGIVTLEEPTVGIPALNSWGMTALAKRFKK